VAETIKASAGQSDQALGTDAKQDPVEEAKRHPVQFWLSVFTLVAGIAAFPLGLVVHLHLAATVLGIASMVVGLCLQMISITREQRIVLMAGVVPAFVGVCLGIAHGGFS
jgi:hypothetical protein